MERVTKSLKNIIWILAVFVSLGIYNEAQAACGTDTVTYGGQTYNTVQIGSQCWFKQNLNVGVMLSSESAMPSDPAPTFNNPSTTSRWCYGNNESSCTTYGGFYTWAEANALSSNCNTANCTVPAINQGICPSGWHIPTDTEYKMLEIQLGMTQEQADATGWRGADQGSKLSTFTLSGTNSSGFTALLSGFRNYNNSYFPNGSWTYFWSASSVSNLDAWTRRLYEGYATVRRLSGNKEIGASVRCVQDPVTIISSSLTTQSTSSILATTATGNGNISNTGNENPTRSIEWGITSGSNYINSCSAGTGGTGAYSCAMTGLLPSTTYYVRAKATNSAGTSYGSETSFTTTAFVCGTDTVIYGGQTYNTVQIGEQCWFKQNLNVGTKITGTTMPDNTAPVPNDPATVSKWCYGDSDANCTTDGGLYSWAEASALSNACNTTSCAPLVPNQGICPTGWHIPTHDEYTVLERAVCTSGTCATDFPFDSTTANGYRGTNEGAKLSALTSGGNNSSGFTGLLGGIRITDGSFYNRGTSAYLWSASENSVLGGWFRNLYSGYATVYRNSDSKAYGFSVRCVQNAIVTSPSLTTQPASDVLATSATGNGNIASTGNENPTRSIEWGTTQGSNYTNSCSAGTGSTGAYSCAMTNLTPGTTYYVRAAATNSAGTSYGEEVSFTTLQTKASVTTSPTTNILTTAATGNAAITNIGGENPTREIQWGTQSNTYANSCSAGAGSTGTYSCAITGLTPNTTYYARAMATNSAGTSYGQEASFTTLPSQVTISEPDTAKMTNAVTTNYVSISSGTVDSTPQITTNTNITFQDGIVKMDIPTNTQITKTDSGNFNFQNFIAQSATNIVKQTMTNSISAVKIGVVGTKISFSQPITVTIDVDSGYNGRTLDVLYQNDNETDWHSQTSCTITNGKCTFTTNHATTYSVNGSGNMAGETSINLNTDIQEVIALDCGAPTINLGNLTPGTPITGSSTCTATTNANGGYNLSVRRDDATSTLKKNTENSVIISDLTPWDPTTPNSNAWSGNGLGFTVFHSTANKNSAWWGTGTTLTDSNNKYAGFNTAQTDIMRNSAYASSSTATDIGYMLNVPPTQKSGAYSGAITYQVVTVP